MQGVHQAAALTDGPGGGDERLPGDLATEHTLAVLVRGGAAEEVHFDRLEIEQGHQVVECSLTCSC